MIAILLSGDGPPLSVKLLSTHISLVALVMVMLMVMLMLIKMLMLVKIKMLMLMKMVTTHL